jgi:hypothetical protein
MEKYESIFVQIILVIFTLLLINFIYRIIKKNIVISKTTKKSNKLYDWIEYHFNIFYVYLYVH